MSSTDNSQNLNKEITDKTIGARATKEFHNQFASEAQALNLSKSDYLHLLIKKAKQSAELKKNLKRMLLEFRASHLLFVKEFMTIIDIAIDSLDSEST